MYGLTIKWALSRLISVKTVEIVPIGYLRYVDVFASFFWNRKKVVIFYIYGIFCCKISIYLLIEFIILFRERININYMGPVSFSFLGHMGPVLLYNGVVFENTQITGERN